MFSNFVSSEVKSSFEIWSPKWNVASDRRAIQHNICVVSYIKVSALWLTWHLIWHLGHHISKFPFTFASWKILFKARAQSNSNSLYWLVEAADCWILFLDFVSMALFVIIIALQLLAASAVQAQRGYVLTSLANIEYMATTIVLICL